MLVAYLCVAWLGFFLLMKAIEVMGHWEAIKQRLDLTVRLGYVQVYTEALNGLVDAVGSRFRSALRKGYSAGAAIGLFVLFLSVFVLLYNLVVSGYSLIPFLLSSSQSLSDGLSSSTDPSSASSAASKLPDFGVMTPIVPGINLPTSHLAPFFLAVFIAAAFHELGHALAATAEGIQLNGFGVFLLVLYPGAFADLSSHLLSLMHYDRIKVFAAGAFHNLLLSALALICIALLPFLLSPLYQVPSDSVVVSSVHPLSPLAAHITAGEQILSLNRCRLEGQGEASWSECLDRIHAAPVEGFCMPHDFIVGEQDANGNACCHSDAPSKLQCFGLSAFAEPSLCTSARLAADRFRQCSHGLSDCADGELCATPALMPSEKLVKIGKANDDFVLYAGHLSTLWHGIEVSRYLPRFALFSSFLLACPHPLYLMLYYIATLSTGLGVLNLVPAYWLDGEHIMGSILHILWPDDLKKRKRWGRIVLRSSTFLLVANIIVSLIILYYRNRFENQV